MVTNAPKPVVREIACKTILNRSKIGDYSLNCYGGCEHACAYCYARFMQRFHPHPEPWGGFVDVKINAVEILERQLRRARPGNVFVSSACDAWQPIEATRKLTRECCQRLIAHGFQVNALTKSALIRRDLDIFEGSSAQIGITITTLEPHLQALWEPYASSIEDRFQVIQQAHAAGLKTAIMLGPLLPFLSDGPESLDALFAHAADLAVDTIWTDTLNPRPKVWEAVSALLQREYPDLTERYRRILYAAPVRNAYIEGLRERIRHAAAKHHLTDRVSVC